MEPGSPTPNSSSPPQTGSAVPAPPGAPANSSSTPHTGATAPVAPSVPPSSPPFTQKNVVSGGQRPIFSILVAVLALFGALAAAAYLWLPSDLLQRAVPAASAPFLIGGILPLTGDGASFGVPIKEAADLAVQEINQNGGIAGRPVEIVWRDGKCGGENAEIVAEELTAMDINILIGGACSSEVLASAPIAAEAGLLTVSSAATNPRISDLPNVFRTAPSDALAGRIAAQYAFETLATAGAAIITEDTDYTLGLRDVFTESYVGAGGTIVADEVFVRGTTDFKEIVARVAEANPEVVYFLPQTPAPGILIVKELKAQEIEATYLTAEVLLVRDALVEHGEILEGVIGIEVFFDQSQPKAAAMLDAYERLYGTEAIYPHFMGGMYDLLYLIKNAFEQTDGTMPALEQYFSSVRDWEGTIGPISFDEYGDPTLPYQIIRITNFSTEQIDVITPSL